MKSYNFNDGISAQPLEMARAGFEPNDPYFIEIKRAQWDAKPKEKTMVVQAQARPGISLEKAKLVFQHAAVNIFSSPGAPYLLDWYDPSEAPDNKPVLPLISMTLIFFPGTVVLDPATQKAKEVIIDNYAKAWILARRPANLAGPYAAAMRRWHSLLP